MPNILCVALVKKGNALLLEKRRHPPYQAGKWTFPWALVSEGENPDETAKRILKEQIGQRDMEPKLREVLHLYQGFPWKPEEGAKDFVFVYEVEAPKEVRPNQEIEELRFREPYEIIQEPDLHHFHRDIAQALGIGWKPLGINLKRDS